MPQKYQKAVLSGLQAGLHKNAPANVVHKVNDANKALPYDIAGGGNVPYTGPVKNAANAPWTGGGAGGTGQNPVSKAGKPGLPFTK